MPIRDPLLQWLDDLLLFTRTDAELLVLLRQLFEIFRRFGLKLHPRKCILFARRICWCGRLIDEAGVRFDPRQLQGLIEMPPPLQLGLTCNNYHARLTGCGAPCSSGIASHVATRARVHS
jgi:hypothetical protein